MNTSNPVNTSASSTSGRPSPLTERPAVRSWRVGSLSMGITLMMIGTALAVSLWQDAEAYELLLWIAPVVFIMLGAELLIYLKVAGKRDMVVRYDWISVMFVGLLGMGSLVLALLMSTGLFDEIQREMNMTKRTAYIETEKVPVLSGVEKVVIQSQLPYQIAPSSVREVQLMGQIFYWSADSKSQLGSELMNINIVDSVMYIFIGEPTMKSGGLSRDSFHTNLVLALPEGVVVEEL